MVEFMASLEHGRTDHPSTAVIIPVFNEEQSLPLVLAAIPMDLVDEVIVVDNGSTDGSAQCAEALGARVVPEGHRGYGAACLRGIAASEEHSILVFLDGDYSDYPEDMRELLAPVVSGEADMVIGSRMLSPDSRRALLPQARFGNQLAAILMRGLFGIRCSDLGPFRVIQRSALISLEMQDRDFGWTVEMQLRAKLRGLKVREVPVRYRKRIGESKITGTLRGTMMASYKILKTIFSYRIFRPRFQSSAYVGTEGSQ